MYHFLIESQAAGTHRCLPAIHHRGSSVRNLQTPDQNWCRTEIVDPSICQQQWRSRGTPAQGNLGAMYAFGTGVLKDYVYAHMWGNIAVSIGGKNKGKVRDFVEEKMTPSQIEKAHDLARECVAKNYKGC